MLFFYPMWDNESQRLGKKQCTPVGYTLHGIAELLGFLGFLLLLGVISYLVYEGVTGSFQSSMLKLLLVPFGMGFVSEALYRFSWTLAIDRIRVRLRQSDRELGRERPAHDLSVAELRRGPSVSDELEPRRSVHVCHDRQAMGGDPGGDAFARRPSTAVACPRYRD